VVVLVCADFGSSVFFTDYNSTTVSLRPTITIEH